MWYNSNANRLEKELSSLEKLLIPFSVDEDAKAKGFLRIFLTINQNTAISGLPSKFLPLTLTVVYPSSFPYFRPEVYAFEISLPRHHNPIAKNLCLLPRQTNYWLPETTIGECLSEQLPKVLIEGEIVDPNILRANPEEQGEPASEYYQDIPNAPILIDVSPFDSLPLSTKIPAFLGSFTAGFPMDATLPSRIWALESFDATGKSIQKQPTSIFLNFPPRTTGVVYSLSERPPHGTAAKDYIWLIDTIKQAKIKFNKPQVSAPFKKGSTIDHVVGITFPEEHSAGQQSRGWLFIIASTEKRSAIVNNKTINRPAKIFNYAKVNRINMNELSFRIESLKPLTKKVVVIFGLGALGAPTAIELAKNGVAEMHLVDFDTVNAGTIVRWPLGVSAAGMYKTDALMKFLSDNYPNTKVNTHLYRVGSCEIDARSPNPVNIPQEKFIEQVLAEASLVYDATAEIGISHFLSVEARIRKIPFISVYATPGVWGGAVMRVLKETAGCWMCCQYAMRDGLIPNPPINQNGMIQPAGCGDISFTGTSFELDNVVAAGVRLAASTMCSAEGGYRELDADVAILSLVDDHGNHIFPRWSVYKLLSHPDCPYCNPPSK